ncbi:MAG: hypothetical protein P4L33_19890 [Capsulimonadaceae bacterium]|nr:hypothetical protein [Capsulimonadaceae bacterium]
MIEHIQPYQLPFSAQEPLLNLAAESDFLILGEPHGTQEVPRLVLALLPELQQIGFGVLGLEISSGQRDQLVAWSKGTCAPSELFFREVKYQDGRGNVQVLSMIKLAMQSGWNLACFDIDLAKSWEPWSARDHGMAENLVTQMAAGPPRTKALCICGNCHSRLQHQQQYPELWPSFAHYLQEAVPHRKVNTLDIVFGSGAGFNMGIKAIGARSANISTEASFVRSSASGHSAQLFLPVATPATFLDNDSR